MTNEYNPDGKEIRFIDSHYKDLFHIPDGSCVHIHYLDSYQRRGDCGQNGLSGQLPERRLA